MEQLHPSRPTAFATSLPALLCRTSQQRVQYAKKLGGKRLVAYPHPQVIFQYFDGRTGELAYAESVTIDH